MKLAARRAKVSGSNPDGSGEPKGIRIKMKDGSTKQFVPTAKR